MKKVVIVSTSMRANSNSEILARECERGAKEVGNEVEFISLKGKQINYCIGCLACQHTGKCVLRDDVVSILEKVQKADTLVFATPIYYYEMSGQMKTLLDRLNPLYSSDYHFRKIYMIATAAEEGGSVFEKAYHGFQGWVDCFDKAELCGLVAGGGITDGGVAKSHTKIMKHAYELGKNL